MPPVLAVLKQAGCRITAPRRAMARVLDDHSGQHLSAGEISAILRSRRVKVNLASIYRNLKLFERLGAVHRGGPPHAHSHFELEHGAEVHLVCTVCGGTVEATGESPRAPLRWLRGLATAKGFTISEFQVEARGICRRCSKSNGRRAARR